LVPLPAWYRLWVSGTRLEDAEGAGTPSGSSMHEVQED